jgi:hypothetical protein
VPCPTASNTLAALGTELYIAPPSVQTLLPALAPRFVHPTCLTQLPQLFADARYQRALRMQLFTPQQLAVHLPTVLPDGWRRSASDGLGKVWDGAADGGGCPTAVWLGAMWTFLEQVRNEQWIRLAPSSRGVGWQACPHTQPGTPPALPLTVGTVTRRRSVRMHSWQRSKTGLYYPPPQANSATWRTGPCCSCPHAATSWRRATPTRSDRGFCLYWSASNALCWTQRSSLSAALCVHP